MNQSKTNDLLKEILLEKVNILLNGSPLVFVTLLFNSLIYVFVCRDQLPLNQLLLWYSLVVLVTLLRFYFYFKYKNIYRTGDKLASIKYYYIFSYGAIVSGILYGILPVFFFPENSVVHQAFLILLIAGMSAGAVSVFSVSGFSVNSYLSIVLLSIFGRLLYEGGEVYTSLALLDIYFYILMLVSAKRNRSSFEENIRIKNENLLSRIKTEHSEKKLKSFFSASPMGIFILKKNGDDFVFSDWNDASCKTLAINCSQLDGNNVFSIVKGIKQESLIYKQMLEVLQTGANLETEFFYDEENRKGFFEIYAFKISEDLLGMMFSDISPRKKTEKQLIEAKEEAENANKAKSLFLSKMSHELRTPLNAILGFTQLIEMDESSLSKDHLHSLEEIREAGYHLLNLINDVLDLAKIETGHLLIKKSEIDVGQLLKECQEIILPDVKRKNIIFYCNYEKWNHTKIISDPIRIKQVIINFLSNAVKYNKPFGDIYLDCKVGESLFISVQDSGKGIPENLQDNLFHMFDRLDAAKTTEGTGIGLVISKNIVEMMNGKIGVSSNSSGSKFWFDIPVDSA